MTTPSFEDVARFVREESGYRGAIAAGHRIEGDLRFVGDDAVELLQAAERRFAVRLHDDGTTGDRRCFDLADDEVLFSAEGLIARASERHTAQGARAC